MRHLLAGRTEAFDGEIFCGEVADETKIGGSANPAMVGVLRPALAAGRPDEAATRSGPVVAR